MESDSWDVPQQRWRWHSSNFAPEGSINTTKNLTERRIIDSSFAVSVRCHRHLNEPNGNIGLILPPYLCWLNGCKLYQQCHSIQCPMLHNLVRWTVLIIDFPDFLCKTPTNDMEPSGETAEASQSDSPIPAGWWVKVDPNLGVAGVSSSLSLFQDEILVCPDQSCGKRQRQQQ